MGDTVKDIRRRNLAVLVDTEAGGNLKAFTTKYGLVYEYIRQILTGTRGMGDKTARKIEDGLLLNRGWIDTPHDESVLDDSTPEAEIGAPILIWRDPEELKPSQSIIIPRYPVWFEMGRGNHVFEEPEEELGNAFRADFAVREGWSPKTHFTVKVRGDSMIEAGIRAGWTVVVDSRDTVIEPDGIYAIMEGDEPMIKYLEELPNGGLRIISANSTHPRYKHPRDLTPEQAEHVRVLGRVVYLQGKIGKSA